MSTPIRSLDTMPRSPKPPASRGLALLPRRRRVLALSLGLWLGAGLAAGIALVANRSDRSAPDWSAATSPSASRLVLSDQPVPVPAFGFTDADGTTLGLESFAGQTVLLNLWATWCLPCREEMPALDRLQAELGGPDFEVVALSIDRGGREAVERFFDEVGVQRLRVYLDQPNASTRALAVVGLPTTLLVDREGRELGRATGPAEWDGPDAIALIRQQIELTATGDAANRSGAPDLEYPVE